MVVRTAGAVTEIAKRVDAVCARVAEAAGRAGRDPAEVTIVAVAKTFPPEAISTAVDAGINDIGENRVQELRSKQSVLDDPRIRWHFVGSLQLNKVRHVAGSVVLIHGVDSPELAGEIARRAERRGIEQDLLLQVNVSGETSKHGVRPEDALGVADAIAGAPGAQLRGLMTIPPAGDPDASRRAFAALRALRARIASEHPGAVGLSMGMSDDFEIAIEEGATHVRIGRALFGPREG
ncbi:MAG TPA: YggS family pyridoxal phosphate-dependent enzyme [Actinomycetota bacterium]